MEFALSEEQEILMVSVKKMLDENISIDNLREHSKGCLLYTSPSPRDGLLSRMPSSA